MYSFILKITILSFFFALAMPQSYAQELETSSEVELATPVASEVAPIPETSEEPIETLTGDPQVEDMVRRSRLYDLDFLVEQIGSSFFTSFEQSLIIDSRKGFVARAPTDFEIEQSIDDAKEGKRPPMGPREVSLGGIVYMSPNDWTIWLNGQKITPDRLPKEILDIRVHRDYIKLKVFDAYTNQIFPIKLRTHQRFNIDTRIFLPG